MGMTDVYMMSKGPITTVHDGIQATATSDPVDCRGFNAVLVYFTTSAANNWTIKVQGSDTRNGTYADCYELANTGSMAAMSYHWIKIVATEDADGSTVTVKVQPLNV